MAIRVRVEFTLRVERSVSSASSVRGFLSACSDPSTVRVCLIAGSRASGPSRLVLVRVVWPFESSGRFRDHAVTYHTIQYAQDVVRDISVGSKSAGFLLESVRTGFIL